MQYDDVISHFQSVARAAEKLGFTPQAIYKWRNNGEIPERTQLYIQAKTRGKLRADADGSR